MANGFTDLTDRVVLASRRCGLYTQSWRDSSRSSRYVCELLQQNMYDPIMAGEEIKMAPLPVKLSDKDTSLLAIIQEAVKQGGGDTRVRAGVLKFDEEGDEMMSDGY